MSLLRIIKQALGQALAGPIDDQDRKSALLKLAGDFKILFDELGSPGADNGGATRRLDRVAGDRQARNLRPPTPSNQMIRAPSGRGLPGTSTMRSSVCVVIDPPSKMKSLIPRLSRMRLSINSMSVQA